VRLVGELGLLGARTFNSLTEITGAAKLVEDAVVGANAVEEF
jgi:hypothetical protein